jgi:hypothetical protein
MVGLELKIISIESNLVPFMGWDQFYWKFILELRENKLLLYAGARLDSRENYGHVAVAQQYGLFAADILGGGDIAHDGDSVLAIGDWSAQYGIVPNAAMGQFAPLIASYLQDSHVIKEVIVDMHFVPGQSDIYNSQHVKRWNCLGYQFDDKKKIVSISDIALKG